MASGIVYVRPDNPRQIFVNEVGVAARGRYRGLAAREEAELAAVSIRRLTGEPPGTRDAG